MPDTVLFSVVIPAYNAASTIAMAIESVLRQSYPAHEIIVVDDGSRDNTVDIVKELLSTNPIVRVFSQPNAGPSAARNTGAFASSGDWVAFLDSDDYWLPHKLKLQAEAIAKHPNIIVAAGKYCTRYPWQRIIQSDPIKALSLPQHRDPTILLDSLVALAEGPTIWTGTVCVKRESLLAASCFDESLRVCEDSDLWFRLALSNPNFLYIDVPVSLYTVRQCSSLIGGAAQKFELSRIDFLNKIRNTIVKTSSEFHRSRISHLLQRKIDSYFSALVTEGTRNDTKLYLHLLRELGLPPPSPELFRSMRKPRFLTRLAAVLRLWAVRLLIRKSVIV